MMHKDAALGRFGRVIFLYVVFSVAVLAVLPLFGGEVLDPNAVWQGLTTPASSVDSDIFLFHRIPRVLTGFMVGGALSVSGGGLQTVLGNHLAEPYVLGIAGAAAVGAAAAVLFPGLSFSLGPLTAVHVYSLAGGLLCSAWVFVLARNPRRSMAEVLLVGVAFNVICASLILLLRYLAGPYTLIAVDRWLTGGLDVVGFSEPVLLSLPIVAGTLLMLSTAGGLNQLLLGEEVAAGRGVDLPGLRRRMFVGMGLATSAAVALAGPIGFVGLLVPHTVRKLSGPDHRLLLPSSFLAGGVFLCCCDLVARTVLSPTEMPVGIITALTGGPVFIKILVKRKSL